MKTRILLFCSVFSVIACTASKITADEKAGATTAGDYGYTETNPIRVGGGTNGPANERRYLERLTGPNGEPIAYVRLGAAARSRRRTAPGEGCWTAMSGN